MSLSYDDEPISTGSYRVTGDDIALSHENFALDSLSPSFAPNGMLINFAKAQEVNKHLIQGAVDYGPALGEETSLGLFCIIWSSLYFIARDIIIREGIEIEVEMDFANTLQKLFEIRDSKTTESILSMHGAIQNDLVNSGIKPTTTSEIMRVHDNALAFASYVGLYHGPLKGNDNQRIAFFSSSMSIRKELSTMFRRPPMQQPAPSPVHRPAAHQSPPRSTTPSPSLPKSDYEPNPVLLALIIIVALFVLICAVSYIYNEIM